MPTTNKNSSAYLLKTTTTPPLQMALNKAFTVVTKNTLAQLATVLKAHMRFQGRPIRLQKTTEPTPWRLGWRTKWRVALAKCFCFQSPPTTL
mmetsp:Transcript_29456/g.59169  ORF Transcript_29456/g.59169 Transcript_29456/m.59169 type:complete len:92 (+) Transcript_29456:1502-1777(+)